MKLLTADDVYKLANSRLSDADELAVFNLAVEVSNGALPYELIEGPADVLESDTAEIAVTIALASVDQTPCQIKWIYDHDHADQQVKLFELLRNIEAVPQPKLLIELERPPFTLAALAACVGSDGRFAYALFRHPDLSEPQARMVLISSFPPEESENPPTTLKN